MAYDRPSTVDRLGSVAVALIRGLLIEGKFIPEIEAALLAKGYEVSRTALARHVKVERIRLRARDADLTSKMIFSTVSEGSPDLLGRNNLYQLSLELYEWLNAVDDYGRPVERTVDERLKAARLQGVIMNAFRVDSDRMRKEREAGKQDALDAVDKVAATKGSGLTAETRLLLRAAVLGEGA